MADLQSVGLDLNTPITQDREDAAQFIATPYFEDFLQKLIGDLDAINTEIAANLTDVTNLGAGSGVFAQLNGQIIELKSLVGGAGITLTPSADEIEIAASAGASIAPGTEASTIAVWDAVGGEWVELPEIKFTWAAGVATFTLEDGVGVDVTGWTVDGDGNLVLYFDNTPVARTVAAGVGGFEVNNLDTGAGFERVLTESDQPAGPLPTPTVANSILRSNGTNAWLELTEVTIAWAAGVATVQVEDGAAALVDGLVIDGDAEATLFFDDAPGIGSAADGGRVIGVLDDNPQLDFVQDDLTTRNAYLQANGAGALILEGEVHGQPFRLIMEDTGGVDRDGIYYDPDTGISFNDIGAGVSPPTYTPTNVTTDRSYDANATTLDEIADVLGTLIADLQAVGLLV